MNIEGTDTGEGMKSLYGLPTQELELNQKFIDLIYEYEDLYEDEPELKHPKGLMKFIWNKGYKISPR